MANRDAVVHYGFADPSNYLGVKGYEAYAERAGAATAVLADQALGKSQSKLPGYHASNLMIGTPDEVIRRIEAAQKACSFCEITILAQFGTMPYDEARGSLELFAREVLPVVQKMEAPIQRFRAAGAEGTSQATCSDVSSHKDPQEKESEA